MEILKICTKCKIAKSRGDFRSRIGPKANKDGLNATCRKCDNIASKQYNIEKNKVKLKFCFICNQNKHFTSFAMAAKPIIQDGNKYYKCIECIEKLKEQKRLSKIKHKDNQKKCSVCKLFIDYDKYWNDKHNPDGLCTACIECSKKYRKPSTDEIRQHNREEKLEYQRAWDNNRRATDPAYKLRRNVKNAILASIRNYGFFNQKLERLQKAIFDHLPYTAEELKVHIESLWEPWMNWENYGKYNKDHLTWQIDHIIPQSSLSFTDFKDDNFIKLWSLSNLQPLETIANIKKGKKIITTNPA
jgi:hypothetical protein